MSYGPREGRSVRIYIWYPRESACIIQANPCYRKFNICTYLGLVRIIGPSMIWINRTSISYNCFTHSKQAFDKMAGLIYRPKPITMLVAYEFSEGQKLLFSSSRHFASRSIMILLKNSDSEEMASVCKWRKKYA